MNFALTSIPAVARKRYLFRRTFPSLDNLELYFDLQFFPPIIAYNP